MISRKTTKILSKLYVATFKKDNRSSRGHYYTVDTNELYEFLYDNEYSAYFCNAAKDTYEVSGTRKLKEFLMRLHTGESLAKFFPGMTTAQREKFGQDLIFKLSEDILVYWANKKDRISVFGLNIDRTNEKKLASDLEKKLEIDGYEFRDKKLLKSETEILDVEEESGILDKLHRELQLSNHDIAFHHLRLTEEHYLEERWDDSISNSRKFLESVLQDVVAQHSIKILNTEISQDTYHRPSNVRNYLKENELLDEKEKRAVASLYGLLSNTGGHPYMAERDQARLLRHLALTLAHFVMLRLKGVFNIL